MTVVISLLHRLIILERTRPWRPQPSTERGCRSKERPIPVATPGQEQDPAHGVLQQQPAYPPFHPEGGHEPGHERDSA